MLLTPRYGDPSLMTATGAPSEVLAPLMRQRRRLAGILATLTEEQWQTRSRCAAWTVTEVVAHLVSINPLYQLSAVSGLSGQPTRLMGAFDPATSPLIMVDSLGPLTPEKVLEDFVQSNEDLFSVMEILDDTGWSTTAESPVGHVPLSFVGAHALWDSWVHERDILLPLSLPARVEPDEVRTSLRYIAALGPAFGMGAAGQRYSGACGVEATDPDVAFTLRLGDGAVRIIDGPVTRDMPVLQGTAVELVEALTARVPLPATAPEEWRRLHDGLRLTWNLPLVAAQRV